MTATGDDTKADGAHSRAGRATAWIAVGLIIALFSLGQDATSIWRTLNHIKGSGTIAAGANLRDQGGVSDPGAAIVPAADRGAGENMIDGLLTDSPLYRAGVRDGDLIRFDHPYDAGRAIAMGEVLGITVDRNGQTRHINVTAVQTTWWPIQKMDDLGEVILDLILISSILTGVFILLRSGGRATFIPLGIAFICFGLRGSNPEFATGSLAYPYVSTLCVVILRVMPVLFLAFALKFHEETTGERRGWTRPFLYAFGGLGIAAGCAYSYATQTITRLPTIGTGVHLYVWFYFLNLALIAGVFIQGLRRSDQQARRRYILMLVAIGMVMLARGMGWIGVLLYVKNFHAYFELHFDNLIEVMTATLAFAGPLLFAYATLRNKVLDLGFAVNRALVYGAISTVLLVGFGLIEWASEHFIPIAGKEKSAVVDAAIALTVFLTFHRLRDFVEKLVESIFFRAWHHNEAKLKRFVEQASYFTQTGPLIQGFTAELKRFSGAESALYQQEVGGGLTRIGGHLKGAPKHIDANEKTMVEIRADRKRIDLDASHAGLSAALALPMVHRAEVFGVVLLGPKPSGDDYRPDEKELLAYAAHQIGLDLHALQVEALQARVTDLSYELKAMRSVVTGVPA